MEPTAELDGSGAVVSRFVYATRVNVPDYLLKGGQRYGLVLDHLGKCTAGGQHRRRHRAQWLTYDEFGQVTENAAPGFRLFGYAGGLSDHWSKRT